MLAPVRAGSCRMRSEVLKAKVCLVGDLAVGKTSLIRRFVLDAFEDRYQTTLGAKVTKKVLQIPMAEQDVDARMDLTIWDIMGQPGFQELLREAYDAYFIRTSAKTADGVEEAFQRVGAVVAQRQLEGVAGEEE